jgi:hypothetical protein
MLQRVTACAVAVAAAGCIHPRDQGQSGIVGCWRFDQDYFSVIGRDPATGALLSLRTAELRFLEEPPPAPDVSYPQSRHAVRPIPFEIEGSTRHRWLANSGWEPLGADRVTVRWYNGLFGPDFRLAVRGDTLRGVVRHLSDQAGAPNEPAPASAVRIGCPAPAGGGT